MKLKWCVIGAGGIADRRTIPALLKDENSELVALMDRTESTAKRLGEKYGVAYFTSEEDMLKSIDADAVYIALKKAKTEHVQRDPIEGLREKMTAKNRKALRLSFSLPNPSRIFKKIRSVHLFSPGFCRYIIIITDLYFNYF
jgi:glutamyl-tRNA reductase